MNIFTTAALDTKFLHLLIYALSLSLSLTMKQARRHSCFSDRAAIPFRRLSL